MNRIKTLFFLEEFIYGGCVEAHGPKAALQWYDWMAKMLPVMEGDNVPAPPTTL